MLTWDRVRASFNNGFPFMLLSYVVRAVLSLVPRKVLIDSLDPMKLQDLWFTQSFNGQIKRVEYIVKCFDEISFTDIVETGTFLGNSTIALSCLSSARIHSIEINRSYYKFAKSRIHESYGKQNVKLYNGDSQTVLEELLQNLSPQSTILFLYLDAHWEHELPLLKEVKLLMSWGGPFIALIDDFEVPGDEGFGFDHYKDGIVGESSIPELDGAKLFTLKVHSSDESGARRGTGVIIDDRLFLEMSPKLKNLVKPLINTLP